MTPAAQNVENNPKNSMTQESIVMELGDINLDLDSDKEIHYGERNALYHTAGYICNRISKEHKLCEQDILALGSWSSNTTSIYSKYSKFKTYIGMTSDKSFFYVTDSTFLFFFKMEKIFRVIYKSQSNSAAMQKTFTSLVKTEENNFPVCHQLLDRIISKYFLFRVRINNRRTLAKKKDFSSLSMSNRL